MGIVASEHVSIRSKHGAVARVTQERRSRRCILCGNSEDKNHVTGVTEVRRSGMVDESSKVTPKSNILSLESLK